MAPLAPLELVVLTVTLDLPALLALWEQLDPQASLVLLVPKERLVPLVLLDLLDLREQEVSPVPMELSALLVPLVTLVLTV